MLRFPNGKSNPEQQVEVLAALYGGLDPAKPFTLKEASEAIGKTTLVSAHGYIGKQATEISGRKEPSRNSHQNNVKLNLEMFKIYGWVAPQSKRRTYPLRFTLLGACAAQSREGALELVGESAIGFVNPSATLGNVKAKQEVRFFPLVLRLMMDLEGHLDSTEIKIGPLSLPDTPEVEYQKMLRFIQDCRSGDRDLAKEFSDVAVRRKVQERTVTNSTRVPFALLKYLGWVEEDLVAFNQIYGGRKTFFKITDKGKALSNALSDVVDIRMQDYARLTSEEKDALCRLGVYSQLERAGFDVSSVSAEMLADRELLDERLEGKNFLFSPYQMVLPAEVDRALGIGNHDYRRPSKIAVAPERMAEQREVVAIDSLLVHLKSHRTRPEGGKTAADESTVVGELKKLIRSFGKSTPVENIVRKISENYSKGNISKFYPLVADLFTIAGLPCEISPPGKNGQRIDATIHLEDEWVPIEVKSPDEEERISVKAIRQAIENKVILSSRYPEKSNYATCSLVVGYKSPNERSGVKELIEYAFQAYGIKIAVVNLYELINLAVRAELQNEFVNLEEFKAMKGILRNEISA